MKEVIEGIISKFDGSSALLSIYPDGLFLSVAPTTVGSATGIVDPVAVVQLVSAVPDYNTVDSIMVYRCQFDVYHDSDTGAFDGIAAIKSVFDFASMAYSSGDHIEVRRVNEGVLREERNVWHGFVEYEFWVGEA